MSDDWAELKVTDSMEAEILKAALESIDIPVVLVGETVGRLYGITASDLGSVHVLVPPDRVQEARELIETSQPVDFPEGD
ncbi:MAG: putative signal transducing protein [Candidatus Dormibacteria bacterium]